MSRRRAPFENVLKSATGTCVPMPYGDILFIMTNMPHVYPCRTACRRRCRRRADFEPRRDATVRFRRWIQRRRCLTCGSGPKSISRPLMRVPPCRPPLCAGCFVASPRRRGHARPRHAVTCGAGPADPGFSEHFFLFIYLFVCLTVRPSVRPTVRSFVRPFFFRRGGGRVREWPRVDLVRATAAAHDAILLR